MLLLMLQHGRQLPQMTLVCLLMASLSLLLQMLQPVPTTITQLSVLISL